ncbi:rhodanese-like domain-containing protein [Flavobacterium sp. N1994]|uniref:rhodanese-like domain-containing protein n=1 Tax=Flavobacterium sp. N1994 TaxID=2986827 RepID=UPI0022231C4C|nr:rhodanese-like domain-containing protein [Flavobacterium sp. N1994]
MFKILNKMFSTKGDINLAQIVNDGAFLVDVRSADEFAQGHLKGSVNIPLNQIPNFLSKFKGKKNIVVFCKSGGRSNQAKYILEHNGFTNVYNGGTWENVESLLNK